MKMTCQGYTFDVARLITPYVFVGCVVGYLVANEDWKYSAALPLIYLGWAGCAPNFNLANGCLPTLFSVALITGGLAFHSTFVALLGMACLSTWAAASLEFRIRGKWPKPWTSTYDDIRD